MSDESAFGIGFLLGAIVTTILASLFAYNIAYGSAVDRAAAQFCKPKCPGSYTHRIDYGKDPWLTCVCQAEVAP